MKRIHTKALNENYVAQQRRQQHQQTTTTVAAATQHGFIKPTECQLERGRNYSNENSVKNERNSKTGKEAKTSNLQLERGICGYDKSEYAGYKIIEMTCRH